MKPDFDADAFAAWLVQGFKETIEYRVRNTLKREKLEAWVRAHVPNKNQIIHGALKRALTKLQFQFEEIKQGDATFQLIRKSFREVVPGERVRRFVFIPGLGDSPASWLPVLTMGGRDFAKEFDELIILDFPGYMGFLSHHEMVTSMDILLSVVKLVVEANPPHTLMGHSLGGWLVSKVAQEVNTPLPHLIVIAPSGIVPVEERRGFGDFIVNNQSVSIEELLGKIIHGPKKISRILSEELRSFYSKSTIKEFVESVQDEQFVDTTKPFRAARVSVIWGEKDQFVPSQWMRHWIECYGDTLDAYILKETGHIPQMERPLALTQVLVHATKDSKVMAGLGWKKIQSRKGDAQVSIKETTGTPLLLKID